MDIKAQLAAELLGLWDNGTPYSPDYWKESIEQVLSHYSISREPEVKRCNLDRRIAHFLVAKKIDGLSERTLKNYRDFLSSFSAQINKHVSKITTDDIREYLSYLSDVRGLKPGSMQTHINTMRTFFSWSPWRGLSNETPC